MGWKGKPLDLNLINTDPKKDDFWAGPSERAA